MIDYRIEVAVSLLDPRLKQRVLDILELLFNDTVKARYIDKELSNRYVPRGNRRKVQSQLAIYDYIKSLEQPDTSLNNSSCGKAANERIPGNLRQ